MRAHDFIIQTRVELQEKSQHWSDEELFVKLQRSYIALQFSLPFFIKKETFVIPKGTSEYYLEKTPVQNIGLSIDSVVYNYTDIGHFYVESKDFTYTFDNDRLLFSPALQRDTNAVVVYRYNKEIKTLNCEVSIPNSWYKALRLLFMSEIHEKPTRNTKDRNLSTHYLKLYEYELENLKRNQRLRPINITSNYQRI
jgi:hypothetical protein